MRPAPDPPAAKSTLKGPTLPSRADVHPPGEPPVVPPATPPEPGNDALRHPRARVDELLASILADRLRELDALDPALAPVGRAVAGLVTGGGKRLRPAFVYWGHRAAGGDGDAVWWPAAAVELLHTFALIHDDIMDRSPERRGAPAVHEQLAAAHREQDRLGEASWFGTSAAILAGDLAFVWADQVLDATPLPPADVDRARRVFTTLRLEVMAGQYLDLHLGGSRGASEQEALTVALLKSGRYTVTRPLQLGAALAGADGSLDAAFTAYGDAVGVAFQLRDDVLGLFGDPAETGKGALEDLRGGKRTLLVLRALALAPPRERAVLDAVLGDPDADEAAADRVRRIVRDCGALAAIEEACAQRQAEARRALAVLPAPARDALAALAELAVFRLG